LKKRPLIVLGVALVFFEMATVLVLRAHYTMDVFTGLVTGLYAAYLARLLAAKIEDQPAGSGMMPVPVPNLHEANDHAKHNR
jgi:hypothetical protein